MRVVKNIRHKDDRMNLIKCIFDALISGIFCACLVWTSCICRESFPTLFLSFFNFFRIWIPVLTMVVPSGVQFLHLNAKNNPTYHNNTWRIWANKSCLSFFLTSVLRPVDNANTIKFDFHVTICVFEVCIEIELMILFVNYLCIHLEKTHLFVLIEDSLLIP